MASLPRAVDASVVAQLRNRTLGAVVAWLRARSLTTDALLAVGPAVFLIWIATSLALSRGDVLPGVHVAGVPVGGQNPEAAAELVAARAAAFADLPVTLTVNETVRTTSLDELGFSGDVNRSLDAAMAFGRDRDRVEGILNAAHLSDTSIQLPLAVALDPQRFHEYLDRVDEEHGRPAVDARVTIDGRTVMVAPARAGEGLDRPAILATITDQIRTLEPISVSTTTVIQLPTISTEEAEHAQRVVQAAIDEPLTLTLGEETWPLTPEEMAAMIEVVPDAANPATLSVHLDARAVDTLVAELAEEIGVPEDAWVQDLGTHSWLVPSKTGRTVERDRLSTAIHEAFAQGRTAVAVPVTGEQRHPAITTEDLMRDLGITGVVGVGDSNYAGSGAGRVHNVEQAAYMVDGTLVPPGGVFSFNDAVGSFFSGDYRDAGSYIDGPNGQSLAGGVCQVSTTVFRAALEAGFPIVEWWPHSYRSPFYEQGGWSPGYDASVVQVEGDPAASSDFRFRNPTDAWLMVRTEVTDAGELRVEIHGADPGYTVQFDDPVVEVMEWATDEVTVSVDADLPPGTVLPDQPAMDGLRVTVARRVSDADGETVSVDTFVTTYKSYGAIRRVRPDMAGEDASLN